MRNTKKIKKLILDIYTFGIFIPISSLFISYGHKIKIPNPVIRKLANKKHLKVKKIINNKLHDTLNTLKQQQYEINPITNIIWFCWLQGEKNMPEISKLCWESLKKHANGNEIRFVTFENYTEYITIPHFITKKLENGIIKFAHFADILRIALINKYGGLWIDSTVFITQKIPNEIFTKSFYTVKNQNEGIYISQYRWSSFLLAGGKANPIFHGIESMFYDYLEKDNRFIDYLMLDYFIDTLYQNDQRIQHQIDNIPLNNTQIYALKYLLDEDLNLDKFKQITRDTFFFKLDWRKCNQHSLNNLKQYYKYICEE